MIKTIRKPTILYRVVNRKSHVLNYTTGEVMSFNINKKDILELISLLPDLSSDIPAEVRRFFVRTGDRPNTRLCRSSLIDLGMQFSFPAIVNLELNKNCNLHCIHCYIGDKNLKSAIPSIFQAMEEMQINDFLNSLKRMGVFLIVLTGGEPFINKNFKRFLWVATKKDFVIEIFSNLQHIPEWFLEADPKSLRIGRIQTSIYSSHSKVHDEITTIDGSFKKTIKNLCLLKERGYYVEVATPLMSKNFKTRNDTARRFKGLGIRQDFSWPIVNEYQNPKSNKSSLNISEDQIKQFATEHSDFFIRFNTRNSQEPICAAGKALFSIMSNGDVWPCSQYPLVIENICNDDIRRVINSPVMLEIANRTKAVLGKRISFNFCMGTNYTETGNPFQQPDFMVKGTPCIIKGRRR